MTEGVPEPTLAVRSPQLLMILDLRSRTRTRGDSAISHSVRIIDKQLNTGARYADPVRAVLGRVVRVRLVQEERRAPDLQTRDASEIPEFGRAESALVPG